MEPKKINDVLYEIPKHGDMHVPVRIFASEKLLEKIKQDKSIQQGINVAQLPGIQEASLMMPDAHQGYGLSIGGVAAFDLKEGIITPGGIGFDINCGVRVLTTNLKVEEVQTQIDQLLQTLFKRIPSGVGKDAKLRLRKEDLDEVLKKGALWAVEHGFGTKEDLLHAEEEGMLQDADPNTISQRAKARGARQLGTLGAGNHFLEVQYVDEIYDSAIAKVFGIHEPGQITIMIHCGSRGLGHQVCSDYLKAMEDEFPEIMAKLPEKDLIYAPFHHPLAQKYFTAMKAAANFAWANRHIIAHETRQAFKAVFGQKVKVTTLYDVAHNIAKIETHMIQGKRKEVIVHRKGATRAFPPGHKAIPKAYRAIGQPVLIPGSMGTASYILVGTEEAMQLSFGSSAHGAGRTMSRVKAKKQWQGETLQKELAKQNIHVKAASWNGIAEEAPQAYKDIDEVVKVTVGAKISRPVARLKPLGVIKG